MNIAVIGGGKIGYYLTRTLLEHGHHPTLIERSKETCAFLANELDVPIICGDGTSIEVLKDADVGRCEVVVSVTGQDENNLVCCQLAKKLFHVGKTIAKVNNPKNVAAMQKLGVDIVISSTDNIARLLEHEVDTANIKQLVMVNHGEAAICETELPQNYRLHGKRLSEIKLPNMAIIISISRAGVTIIPRGDTELHSGDRILFMAKQSAMHAVKQLLRLE